MKQGSRARQKRRHQRFTTGSGVDNPTSGSTPSADLTGAADVVSASTTVRRPDPPSIAETASAREVDATSLAGVAPDPREASLGSASARRQARRHIEDEFFARGEELASFPPSSIDALESDDVLHRRPSARVLERRGRMRRIVASGVSAAAALTLILFARAWVAHSSTPPQSDSSLSVANRVVPSIAMATAPQAAPPPSNADPTPSALPDDPPEEEKAEPAPVETRRQLPVVDVDLPSGSDAATEPLWAAAARGMSDGDFAGADKAFAELGRRRDIATRETARLARAIWWTANGKEAEVRPVLADLAGNAKTEYVKRRAGELLKAN
jgi:hypothetical protein